MGSQLDIVYIVDRYPCLSESFIRMEARALMKLGHNLRFTSLRKPREDDLMVELLPEERVLCLEKVYKKGFSRPLAHLGLLVREPGRYLRGLGWVLRNRDAWRLFKAAPYLYDYAKGADWIHGTFAWDQAGYAMVLARLTGIPWSFTARAADIFVNPRLLPLKMREASFIATITEFNKSFLVESLKGDGDKIHVIHSAHCEERFEIKPLPPTDHVRVTAVGRLVDKKGFPHLLRALSIVKPRLDRPLQCRIIGSGPLADALQEEIRELGLDNEVSLVGALSPEDALKEVAHSHMLVQPCIRADNGDMDGIPNVLMEAMWLGVPVISTRLSGIPELVEHERTGLLAEPGDEKGLAGAIKRLVQDQNLRESLRNQGLEKVKQEFNVKMEAEKLSRLIRESVATSMSLILSRDKR